MGLISPAWENLLDFLELWQVLSTYDLDLRDPLWGPQERPGPCELLGGLSGFLSRRMGAYDLVWSRWRNLRIPLQCSHGSWDSSGVSPGESVLVSRGACTCPFLPSCSSNVTLPFAWNKGFGAFPRGLTKRLSHEAFPQGCPTCHRGVSRSSA